MPTQRGVDRRAREWLRSWTRCDNRPVSATRDCAILCVPETFKHKHDPQARKHTTRRRAGARAHAPNGLDEAAVRRDGVEVALLAQLPDYGRVVVAAAGDVVPVGREVEREQLLGVALQTSSEYTTERESMETDGEV